jgi:hypothetical protein
LPRIEEPTSTMKSLKRKPQEYQNAVREHDPLLS